MMDSCRPRKLEPGLAAQYSMSSDLMTSIMKSAPGRWLEVTSTLEPLLSGFKCDLLSHRDRWPDRPS